MHLTVLLDDVGEVEAHFSPFQGSVNLDARLVHYMHRLGNSLRSHVRRTRWNSYVTLVNSRLVSVRLEIVLTSMLDRCTVCAKCIIGSEIILEAPDGTLT